MAGDTIILDPSEVATGRVQLDISPYVKAEGVDYGDAAIEAFMSDRERGASPVDYKIPNRNITLPLNLKPVQGGLTFAQIRSQLQAKVGRTQAEGGWLRRTTSSGTLFIDVVNATLRFGGDWMQATRGVDVNAELRLECIPDWYGPEIVLPDRVETNLTELVWTETNIAGNYPGRVRIVVDEDQGQRQMGLVWGVRCRHYSNSTTAQLRYEAETCTPLDAAGIASGVVSHSNLSSGWTAVLSTNQTGGVALTHTGTYRVWVRAGSVLSVPSAPLPYLRLVWDVGDFAWPTENTAVQIPVAATPGGGQLCAVDLGEVRLDRVPAGTHRWQGIIQGRGVDGGENVQIDKIWLVPVDEGYGVLRAPTNLESGLGSYSARDEFNQTAGVLTGKALPVGGAWSGAGDTDDFVVNANTGFRVAQRSATGVPDVVNTGRAAVAGTTNFTNVVVQVDFQTAVGFVNHNGVFARWLDINNWLMLSYNKTTIQIRKRVGGTITPMAIVPAVLNPSAWYRLRMVVDTAGLVQGWCYLLGSAPGDPIVTAAAELATGGALQTGRVGFYDEDSTTGGAQTPTTRYYDNFSAFVPSYDAVLHPNQSAELRTEGMFREEATGAAFGPVSHVVGDLPRIPPSGSEGRTVQFFLKASRGDFDSLPDTGVDDISARVSYRPSFLLTA